MAHSTYAINGGNGPALWTHGAKQYGVFIDSADAIRFAQFTKSTRALDGTLSMATVSGNPLSLPLDVGDPHETASLGITPNGIIYLAGNNMDDATPRLVKTTGAVPATNALSAASWTNASSDVFTQASSTYFYFKFSRFAGSLFLIYSIRLTGGNPSGSRMMRHNGTAWTDLGFVTHGQAGTEDAFYRTHVYVEAPTDPHPNRGHLFGAWDRATGGGGLDVDRFSYLYTDNEGTTWRNIAGTPLTLPLNYTGSSTVDTGISFGDPTTSNLYANGCAVDASGYPCGLYHKRTSGNQGEHIIRWNGSTWVDDTAVAFRFISTQAVMLVRFRGDLWTMGRPINGGINTMAELRRVASPNDRIHLAGPVGSGWHCYFDPAALQDTGTIEMLHIDDDVPTVVTFGNHARAQAA